MLAISWQPGFSTEESFMDAAFVAESVSSLSHDSKGTPLHSTWNAEEHVPGDYTYAVLFNPGDVLGLLLDKDSRRSSLFGDITK